MHTIVLYGGFISLIRKEYARLFNLNIKKTAKRPA